MIESTVSINSESNLNIFSAHIGFNVYIRGTAIIGVINNFIDKLHNNAVRVCDSFATFLIIRGSLFTFHPSQYFRERMFLIGRIKKKINIFYYVFFQGDIVFYLLGF